MANGSTMYGEFVVEKMEGCKNTWKEIYIGVSKLFYITERVEYGLEPADFDFEDFPKSEEEKTTKRFIFGGCGRWYSDSFEKWIYYKEGEEEKSGKNIIEFMRNNTLDLVRIVFEYDEEEGGAGYALSENTLVIEIKKDSLITELEETAPEKNFNKEELRFKNGWIENNFKYFTYEDLDYMDPIKIECEDMDYNFLDAGDESLYDIEDRFKDKELLNKAISSYEKKEPKYQLEKLYGEFLKSYASEGLENETINEYVYRISDNKFNSITALVYSKTDEKIKKDYDKAKEKDPGNNITDGIHTMSELYFHRMFLFSVLCKIASEKGVPCFRSKLHEDGTMFDNFFIVGIDTLEGQYSYHYHIDYWDYFDCCQTRERAPHWDGCKSDDLNRLNSIITML